MTLASDGSPLFHRYNPTAGGWVGVDLDGTLAEYDHWRGVEHIGAPIAAMVNRVRRWLEAGVDVRIFTARVCREPPEEAKASLLAIEQWCLEHLGRVLPVTNVKDFQMVVLYDDRARQLECNTGSLVAPDHRSGSKHNRDIADFLECEP